MKTVIDWAKAPAEAVDVRVGGGGANFFTNGLDYYYDGDKYEWLHMSFKNHNWPVVEMRPNSSAVSVSIANLLNAQVSIANARKSSEFSEHNAELADQADAILQAIIGNLKAERIPAEASFHLANAQNELNACAKLLEGDKALAGAVFCIGEKLAGIRKGEL